MGDLARADPIITLDRGGEPVIVLRLLNEELSAHQDSPYTR
jgi:hypothetical protein